MVWHPIHIPRELEMRVRTETCKTMPTVVLFIITLNWRKMESLSMAQCTNNQSTKCGLSSNEKDEVLVDGIVRLDFKYCAE